MLFGLKHVQDTGAINATALEIYITSFEVSQDESGEFALHKSTLKDEVPDPVLRCSGSPAHRLFYGGYHQSLQQ